LGTANNTRLLDSVSGRGPTAIMGPCGAGKSTLLKTLALVRTGARSEGSVSYCGTPVTNDVFKTHMAFVPQHDHFQSVDTVREKLQSTADLVMKASAMEKREAVSRVLDLMGLASVADKRICDWKGDPVLSGGEQKKLSIAIALLYRPSVLFVDEPTTSLDSAAAANVMQLLRRATEDNGTATVLTIHQPTEDMLNSFSDILVLCKGGRVAFRGTGPEMAEYCSEVVNPDSPVVHQQPPAEHMMQLVSDDPDGMAERWRTRHRAPETIDPTDLPVAPPRPGALAQTWYLLHRQVRHAAFDRTLYLGRIATFQAATIIFAGIYHSAWERTQDQVTQRMFLSMWFMGLPTVLSVTVVHTLNHEAIELKRELHNGFYGAESYLVANTLTQIPSMCVMAIASIGVAGFWMADFDPHAFGPMFVVFVASFWCFENMAQMFALIPSRIIGMLLYIVWWFVCWFFGCVFIRERDIDWPLKAFVYILPFRWAIASVVRLAIGDGDYAGAAAADNEPEYVCSGNQDICYGRTGEQVLRSLARQWPTFAPKDNNWTEVGYLVCIALGFKLVFSLLFVYVTRPASPPRTPGKRQARDRGLSVRGLRRDSARESAV